MIPQNIFQNDEGCYKFKSNTIVTEIPILTLTIRYERKFVFIVILIKSNF